MPWACAQHAACGHRADGGHHRVHTGLAALIYRLKASDRSEGFDVS